MSREEVIRYVNRKLDEWEVKDHVRYVKSNVPLVIICVLVDGERLTVNARSGIPQWELDELLANLRTKMILKQGGQQEIR